MVQDTLPNLPGISFELFGPKIVLRGSIFKIPGKSKNGVKIILLSIDGVREWFRKEKKIL